MSSLVTRSCLYPGSAPLPSSAQFWIPHGKTPKVFRSPPCCLEDDAPRVCHLLLRVRTGLMVFSWVLPSAPRQQLLLSTKVSNACLWNVCNRVFYWISPCAGSCWRIFLKTVLFEFGIVFLRPMHFLSSTLLLHTCSCASTVTYLHFTHEYVKANIGSSCIQMTGWTAQNFSHQLGGVYSHSRQSGYA